MAADYFDSDFQKSESPLDALRQACLRWRRAQAELKRARWGGDSEAEETALQQCAEARAALGSGRGRTLLEEALRLGIVDEDGHVLFLRHLADAAREEWLYRVGAPAPPLESTVFQMQSSPPRKLSDWLDEFESVCSFAALKGLLEALVPIHLRLLEAHGEADVIANRVERRGPQREELAVEAQKVLCATDEAIEEARERACASAGLPRRSKETVQSILAWLRVQGVQGLWAVQSRRLRLGLAFRGMGAEDGVLERIRVEAGGVPCPEVALVDPPHEVRLALPKREWGGWSELQTAEALGRAIAFACVASSPAVEEKMAPFAPIAAWTGSLFALLLGERLFIQKRLGSERREGALIGAWFRYLFLAWMRLESLRLLVRAQRIDLRSPEACELASKALGLPPTPELGIAIVAFEPSPAIELRSQSLALAPWLHLALRERFDEDYFRNPRIREFFLSAFLRGARLSRRAWAHELSSSPQDPLQALKEWVAEALA
ncbi:MAG: hypothetical protein NZM37_06030 [Sandaracinaceae bacterium]|nr:hypothetical protein [Sandaracinaceae bacterium]MDW8245398.1 hypothetical protein [Sandaracinaceae bacterium]